MINFSSKKVVVVLGLVVVLELIAGALYFSLRNKPTTPTKTVETTPQQPVKLYSEPSQKTKNVEDGSYHLLLLGLDRRSRLQTSSNTDVIMLISFSADRDTLMLTSIPRDLWLDSAKINAFYAKGGAELIKEKVWQVTGYLPDSYLAIDFDAVVWFVESLNSLDVRVERGFTDSNYPDDRSGVGGLKTVSFNQGTQILTGEEVLVYTRSRKGDNGEGSDFARMRRQQQVIKALAQAFLSPGHLFYPFKLDEFYKLITEQTETDLGIGQIGVLYDLLVAKHKGVQLKQIVLDTQNYLYHPPNSTYGAYVLRPNNESFDEIQGFLKEELETEGSRL